MTSLSKEQWLYSQGGRNIHNVGVDTKGEFVIMMGYNKQLKRVYLPVFTESINNSYPQVENNTQ